MGHALEGGLFDLGDLVLVDAQLLQTLGHVGGHILQHVLRQVEALQLGQRAESFGVDDGDFVVHQDQSLCSANNQRDEVKYEFIFLLYGNKKIFSCLNSCHYLELYYYDDIFTLFETLHLSDS